SDLPMGRWREMSQTEVDILSQEVGLKPVALPDMKTKAKEKIDRMQRKAAKPLPRGERRPRVLRPAQETGTEKVRGSRGEQPARKPRGADGAGRGTSVAARASDVSRGPRKPSPAMCKVPPAADGQRSSFGRNVRSKRSGLT